jgi:hypothetical protein
MLALVFVVSGRAAEPIFGTTPGKLPKTVVPIGYSVEVRANSATKRSHGGEAAVRRIPPRAAIAAGSVVQQVIAISADLKTRALPAVEAWIRERK